MLVWGIDFLRGNNFFVQENKYYAVYEKIDGLVASSPVMVNGLMVGKVKTINFFQDSADNYRLLVCFSLTKDFKVPDSSLAQIISIDLMGSKAIDLQLSKAGTFHAVGDTLRSGVEDDLKEQVSAQMLPLKKKAEDLISSIDSVMLIVQYIFNESSRENIANSITSIKKTIQSLESTSYSLDTLVKSEKGKLSGIFSNIESITFNLNNNSEKISTILRNFAAISDSLAKTDMVNTINRANAALLQANEILEKINTGQGSMGLLINNDTLYYNLEKSSKDLDRLIRDIEANPKKYLHFSIFDFGRTYTLDENGKKIKPNKKNDGDGAYLIPDTESEIIFKVQVRSSQKQIPAGSVELKGLEGIEEIYLNGRFKYTVGNEKNIDKIKSVQEEIRTIFPDAFVIAIKNGKQIPINEALKEI